MSGSVIQGYRCREHSRKPDEQYERIERLVDGPYLEMFEAPERSNARARGMGNVP